MYKITSSTYGSDLAGAKEIMNVERTSWRLGSMESFQHAFVGVLLNVHYCISQDLKTLHLVF